MARIELKDLRHSYVPRPQGDDDFALKRVDVEWKDAGAYALLGPSGCGKSTLLNIISGLLTPSEGRILFDGQDVTTLPPDARHIAQVFQFPVVYDTMTVYENLAFPLRNRGADRATIDARVRAIADMLELTDMLDRRASGLAADNKQKISMGRGLVREDVNAILFDEPLTVIDPHLKWKLRSKLKELHQRVKVTMIYVTHDQTEALTFADEVIVMQEGEVVQIGTPVELFERPAHSFVGHFIGSPGMNLGPCEIGEGGALFEGVPVPVASDLGAINGASRLELGVRPEFVRFADAGESGGVPVDIVKVADVGRFKVVETRSKTSRIYALVPEGQAVPSDGARLMFDPAKSRVYVDDWAAPDKQGA